MSGGRAPQDQPEPTRATRHQPDGDAPVLLREVTGGVLDPLVAGRGRRGDVQHALTDPVGEDEGAGQAGRGAAARDQQLGGRGADDQPGRRAVPLVEVLTGRRLEDDLAKELGLRERDQLLALLKRFRKLATAPEIDDATE